MKHLISNSLKNIFKENIFIKNTLSRNNVKRTLRVCLTMILGSVTFFLTFKFFSFLFFLFIFQVLKILKTLLRINKYNKEIKEVKRDKRRRTWQSIETIETGLKESSSAQSTGVHPTVDLVMHQRYGVRKLLHMCLGFHAVRSQGQKLIT